MLNLFPPGIAACNIGGVTIHSFGGIGLGIESAEDLANKIKKNKKAIARWLRTKVLIIDEGRSLSILLSLLEREPLFWVLFYSSRRLWTVTAIFIQSRTERRVENWLTV
jgi:hypothetical protein